MLYRKAKEILYSGRLGRIMTIEANENIPPPMADTLSATRGVTAPLPDRTFWKNAAMIWI